MGGHAPADDLAGGHVLGDVVRRVRDEPLSYCRDEPLEGVELSIVYILANL
jgi:hypothetical protein